MFWIRFRSSCIIMAVTIAVMVLGGYYLFGALTIISLIGLMELFRTVGVNKKLPGIWGYLSCAGLYTLILFNLEEHFTLLFVGFLLILLLIYVLSFPKYNSEQITMVFFGLFYVALTLSYIYRVRCLDNGAYIVWMIFIGAWGSDTCAYLVGRKLGKHKIAPKLSPKKSVEGCIGGLIGAGLIGFIYATIFKEQLNSLANPQLVFAVIGACSSVISQIGDMAASAIKRNKDIKDYGRLIPGHGGILDRFDSILFIAPLVYYLIEFMA